MNELDTYHLALGRFTHTIAVAEWSLKFFLARVAGLDRATAQALFSGTRTKAAVSFVNRTLEVRGATIEAPYVDALARLSSIDKLRDEVIHHGTHWMGSKMAALNVHHTIPRQQRRSEVSASDLDDLTHDLQIVSDRLLHYCALNTQGIPMQAIQQHEPALLSAWRYKLP
jgi:hypothetical protein